MKFCYWLIGDKFEHNNEIFDEYNDYCRVKAGKDHLWSIGTDSRQMSLLNSGWKSPQAMREMLNDDVQRRYYILDADIEVNRLKLGFEVYVYRNHTAVIRFIILSKDC